MNPFLNVTQPRLFSHLHQHVIDNKRFFVITGSETVAWIQLLAKSILAV